MMLLKITLFCVFGVFGVMQCLCGLRSLFSTYCTLLLLRLSETRRFLQAHRSEKRGVL